MRLSGTKAYGVRLPIISKGDNLPNIVVNSLVDFESVEKVALENGDVVGVTEAIVAKSQGNYASIDAIAQDIKNKFGDDTVGVVFPILSRNRFMNILKGVAKGAKKVYVLLSCPQDEVGNPIMDIDLIDELEEELKKGAIKSDRFKELTNNFLHPFTGMDYIALYESLNPNIEVIISNDPRDILKYTTSVLVAEIHTRNRTKARILKAGGKKVFTLSDILTESIDGSGYNEKYGVLGSNISTENMLKLFPRDCDEFVATLQKQILDKTSKTVEVLVYGDGAFKDPSGIWELADPVVSPGFTAKLGGQPTEIKLKYVADNNFSHLFGEEKTIAVTQMIKDKATSKETYSEGTTPRKYADLLGSLCDLMSGSGDKGTPVIIIKGYFDNYASE